MRTSFLIKLFTTRELSLRLSQTRFLSRYQDVSIVVNNSKIERYSSPGVVFVLGWAGCSFKQLQRYSDIYEKRGESVIKYCPNPILFFKYNGRREYQQGAREILDLIRQNNLDRRPVFFHNLCNGGSKMYLSLCKEMVHSGIPIRGTIFDSTPSRTGFYMIRGSVAELISNPLLKLIVASGLYSYSQIFARVKVGLDTLRGRDASKTEDYRFFLFRSLVAQANTGPQLCLYSKTDEVTFYKDVMEFIEERKKLGVDIESKLWEESKHVKHMLEHTDEYLSLVEKFFERCYEERNYATRTEVAENEIYCREKA